METMMGVNSWKTERIFCIGRNYRAHAAELGNAVPESPVIFMKPGTCLRREGEKIPIPTHGQELHHEAEVVLLIGTAGKASTIEEGKRFIAGISLGLDLTLRDVQNRLKNAGLPWELSKAFDGSSPVGDFCPVDSSTALDNISFRCVVNGVERQRGNTGMVLFSFPRLVLDICKVWSLLPGDLIYTGTPEGVGPLYAGDTITVESDQIGKFTWTIG
jgi:2-keto-4-pentenoate hydratase/2-oxohepta-3-ene-1,7-dioic acid hydratase in catechol pathway